MKVGDLVRAKHVFLGGLLGLVVEFSEVYAISKPCIRSDTCILGCVADSRRSWKMALTWVPRMEDWSND